MLGSATKCRLLALNRDDGERPARQLSGVFLPRLVVGAWYLVAAWEHQHEMLYTGMLCERKMLWSRYLEST